MPSAEAAFYDRVPPTLVSTGDARLAYRRFGAGEPIVFIHGWPLSGFTWRKLLPALAARHTCITIDLAGAGESGWDRGNDFSFHGHAENVRRLLDAIDVGPYKLVAHDTGATVARRLAIIDPARASPRVHRHRDPRSPAAADSVVPEGAGHAR